MILLWERMIIIVTALMRSYALLEWKLGKRLLKDTTRDELSICPKDPRGNGFKFKLGKIRMEINEVISELTEKSYKKKWKRLRSLVKIHS